MIRFRRQHCRTITVVLIPLLLTTGCSRPTGLRSDDSATPADSHQVPFHDGDAGASGNSRPGDSATAQNGSKSEPELPFRDPQSLPAGTLLIVRLKNAVSADNSGASGSFEAVVDEPVTIDGNTVVPRGVNAAGRVESARASSAKRGYLRLMLDSIDIAGKDLTLQTSSLFARGNPPGNEGSTGVISLEKGRRLTFRLTEPAYLALQPSKPAH